MKVVLYITAVIVLTGTLFAQPRLAFHRIVNNWPIIELYYTASCNGTDVFNIDSSQIHIADNGMPVRWLDHTCADPPIPNPISVSLVLDATGSMYGAGNTGTRRAFGEFVRKFDGLQDEAGVVYFSNNPWTALGITHDTAR